MVLKPQSPTSEPSPSKILPPASLLPKPVQTLLLSVDQIDQTSEPRGGIQITIAFILKKCKSAM